MKYTVSMVTIMTTSSLELVKKRMEELEETFDDPIDVDLIMGKGNQLVEDTTEYEPDAHVTTHIRIDEEE